MSKRDVVWLTISWCVFAFGIWWLYFNPNGGANRGDETSIMVAWIVSQTALYRRRR